MFRYAIATGTCILVYLVSVSLGCAQSNKEKTGTNAGKKTHNGSTVPATTKPADISECPVKVPIKPEGYELVTPAFVPVAKANLLRSTQTMKFDMITLNDIKLNIPAFKQFKNNKTDFTADGEQVFKELTEKVRAFLATDNKGKPFVIRITGSASQIPTSFDPSKPNNNLKPDGGSIAGQTSIENNKLLAKARADELAKKLKHAFPVLNIITPTLNEIQLGTVKWTTEHQKRLNEASKKKDRQAIDLIFEPFQKDQWVKVESADITSKAIQPEATKMYMLSTTPPLKTKLEGKEQSVKTIFIVSKNTFDKVGGNKTFGSVTERDRFLKRYSLKIFHQDKDSLSRWYLLGGKQEIDAFNTPLYTQKVVNLYKAGVADIADELLIENYIKEEVNRMYR